MKLLSIISVGLLCSVDAATTTAAFAPTTTPVAKYTFIVSAKASAPPLHGLHIHEVDFVGADITTVKVVPKKDGEYCVGSEGKPDRHGESFDNLVDGKQDTLMACNVPAKVGTTGFEITAPADITALKITYSRPLYAPGWKILRDGVEVLNEKSNRGDAQFPEPVSYDYVLSAGTTTTIITTATTTTTAAPATTAAPVTTATPTAPVTTVGVCGDSKKVGSEACDDGNTVAGDGCNADCSAVESGYKCGGGSPSKPDTCNPGDAVGTCTAQGQNARTCTCPAGYHGSATLVGNAAFDGCYANPTTYEDWVIKMRPDVGTNGNPLTTTANAVAYDDSTKKMTVKFEKSGGRTHKVSLFKGDCSTTVAPNGLLAPANGQLAGVNTRNTKHEFLHVTMDVDLSKMQSSNLLDKVTNKVKFCVRVDLEDGVRGVSFIEAQMTMQVTVVGNIQQVSVQLQRAEVIITSVNATHVVQLDACQCDASSVFVPSARCTVRASTHTAVSMTSPPRLTQSDRLSLCISTQSDDVQIEEIKTLTLTQENPSSGVTQSFGVIAGSTAHRLASYDGVDKQKGHLQRVKTNLPNNFFSTTDSGGGAVNQLDITVSGTAKVVLKGRRRLAKVVIKRSLRSLQQQDESEGEFSMTVHLQQENDEVDVSASPSLYVGIPLVAAAALAHAL